MIRKSIATGLVGSLTFLALMLACSGHHAAAASPTGPGDNFPTSPGDKYKDTAPWVERLRMGPVEELEEAGKEALPVWVAAAADNKARTWLKHALQFELSKEDWIGPIYLAMLDQPYRPNQSFALGAFENRPELAKQVAPRLIKKAREWLKVGDASHIDLVESVVKILCVVDSPPKESVALVKEVWDSRPKDQWLRRRLLQLLAVSGSDGVSAMIDLQLKHEKPLAELVHYVDHFQPIALEELDSASRDPALPRRRVAAAILAHLAQSDASELDKEQVAEGVARMVRDSDPDVRRNALPGVKAIAKLESAKDLLPKLEELLANTDTQTRHATARAIAAFGDAAMPVVERSAEHEKATIRIVAATMIAGMEETSEQGIGILLKLAEDRDAKVRRYAAYSLGETHSADPRVAAALVDALNDEETSEWASRALKELGPNAKLAVSKLREDLNSNDLRQRLRAASAIWAISGDANLVLPIATAIAQDDQGITTSGYYVVQRNVDGKRVEQRRQFESPLAARAARLLGDMGTVLGDMGTELGDMGTEASTAVDALIAMLDHENRRAQTAAVVALGKIGPAAEKAIPELERLVKEGAPQQTRNVLKKIRESSGQTKQ